MLSPYWLHRNPKYFPDPEMFKPVSCDSYWGYFAVFSPLISQQKHKDKLAFKLVIRYRLERCLVCRGVHKKEQPVDKPDFKVRLHIPDNRVLIYIPLILIQTP